MISPERFIDFLQGKDISFFSGVPDSLLQSFCVALFERFGPTGKQHMVAVNEGNAVALGAGYHLATGKVPLVYLQNSGLGNAVNPAASLTDPAVYGIPIVYLVGWRGEPGVHDEPQHVKQGEITCSLLEVLGIPYVVIDKQTSMQDLETLYDAELAGQVEQGRSVAFVARKGSFESPQGSFPAVDAALSREQVIRRIADTLGKDDYIVSTTGKISRELFEHRKATNSAFKGHDFLTVGSMGHASAIALSISMQHPQKRIWCLDGDGAALMHMGSMATIGAVDSRNLVHVVLNNASHESVGGMPTAALSADLCKVASACGYRRVLKVGTAKELEKVLGDLQGSTPALTFVEIMVSSGSRTDLIRPDTTPQQNKTVFMECLQRN